MILNYIVWNPNPELFELAIPGLGTLAPRWYGLLFAMGFVVGYIIMLKIFKKERVPVKVLDQLATYMIIATIVGARLGHVLFYEPMEYLKNPIEILMVWKGGLASHGAGIAIIIAMLYFSKRNNKPFIWVFDRISIVVALAGFFIRTGNLMNSEIIGEATTVPWAFIFSSYDNVPRHPTQIYEALCYLAIAGYLYWCYWKTDGKPRPGFIFGMFLILLFTVRFFIEFVKEPQVSFEVGMALNMGQWLSIPFVLIGLYIVLRKPGT